MATRFLDLLRELARQASLISNFKAKLLTKELEDSVRREAMRQILVYQGKVNLDIRLDEIRERGDGRFLV